MSLNKSQALNAAKQYVLQRRLDAAIEIYREVVEADPSDLAAINTLGDLYASTGRVQDAVTQFLRVADGYLAGGSSRKAIATLKKVIAADPANIETAVKLADLYSEAGLPSEARQQYLQIADAHTRNGQTLEALQVHGKIVALDPSNASTRIKLGELYLREGMYDQAYESFVMAAGQLVSEGENRRALNAYKEALAVRPDSVEAGSAVANLIRALGLVPEKGARSLSPQSVEPDEPHKRVSSHLPRTSELPPASLTPVQHPETRDNAFVVQEISKAEFMVAYGKVEHAITMLKDVLRSRPDDVDVHIKLKDIYLRTGMMAEAAQECESLARIHDDLGDPERALDYAVRAKRLCQSIDNSSGGLSEPKSSVKDSPHVHSLPLKADSDFADRPKAPEVTNALDTSRKRTIEATASRMPAKFAEDPPAPQLKLVCEDQPQPPAPDAELDRQSKLVCEKQPEAPGVEVELAPQVNLVCEEQPQPPAAELALAAPSVYETIIGDKNLEPLGSNARSLPALFAQSSPVRKTRGSRFAAAMAAIILLVLALGVVIAGFIYDSRLDKQYQSLASAAPPLTFPPLPEPVSEEPEPVQPDESVTVMGAPPPQPDLSTRTQKPEPDVLKTEQPIPSNIPATEPPKVTPRQSPSPPRAAISADNHPTGEDHTPAGVPSSVPVAATQPGEPPPKIVRQSPGVVVGGAVKRVEPSYPPAARTARLTGAVTVEVTINEQGNVASARATSGPLPLREAAVSAARGWRFRPSTRDGLPMVTMTTIVFNFKL